MYRPKDGQTNSHIQGSGFTWELAIVFDDLYRLVFPYRRWCTMPTFFLAFNLTFRALPKHGQTKKKFSLPTLSEIFCHVTLNRDIFLFGLINDVISRELSVLE